MTKQATKEQEEEIMRFWKENKVYEKVKAQRKNARKFYFLDGPPYVTGSIHVGTAMNKVIKDCYLRFYRMLGFNVWDKPGYDTHGVPIENKVEKELGFKTKKEIESYGIAKFVERCRNFAIHHMNLMTKQFQNLGVWMDWENPYSTLSNEYIEGAWFTFKRAFEKGFLYKGTYPVHVCPRCETVVAYNEIVYTKLKDPSVYVKFRVKNKQNEYLVIWTTTPWTLLDNTGVMVKPDAEYSRVRVGDEILIIAKVLVEQVMKKIGIKNYEILDTKMGKELENLKYEHPFIEELKFQQLLTNAHRVVISNQFVKLEEGTGLVHTAPGHGEEDYKVSLDTGLPSVSHVKLNGVFDEICGKYSGIFVKEADKLILQDLRAKGLLLHEETIEHEYPICWRCNTPLIIISIPQWFFKVSAIRSKMIEENKKIAWNPKWASQRFQNWLESLGDWPISRQRYWGIPLPIWVCEKCENIKVIGSREELPKIPKDFHRPYVDEIVLKCDCGGNMRRVPDVLDVWFDSGVAPWASLGFPRNRKLFKKLWPVDFVIEGPDQFRGWWNSLMITSVMVFDKASFKSVLLHGFMLDAHGQKMSKSLQNIVTTEEVIEKYGRDLLRFYYLSNEPWNDFYFNWQVLEEIAKNFVIVKNTFNFIKTYVSSAGKPHGLKQEDKWILSKVNSLVENCTKNFKEHNAHKAANYIINFIINEFSRWYIKLIRDRVWISYEGKDKKAAFFTCLTVTEKLAKLLAPICPFLAEQVYQEIVKPLKKKGKVSVHMEDWPKVEKRFVNKRLEEEMEIAKKIFEACSNARQKAGIRLRWPVATVIIFSKENKVFKTVEDLGEVLLKICNAKDLKIMRKEPKGDLTSAEFDLGKVFIPSRLDEALLDEALLREVIRKIQEMRKKFGFIVKEKIHLSMDSDERTNKLLDENKQRIAKEVGATSVSIGRIKGKFLDELSFEDRKVKIGFEKTR
ncbi:MAG: isoleucine--tRNA ligase [Candidatus Aenigmatarchaeota archaeon]